MMIILSVCLIDMAEVKKNILRGYMRGKEKPNLLASSCILTARVHYTSNYEYQWHAVPPPNFCIVNVMVRLLSQILNLRLEV